MATGISLFEINGVIDPNSSVFENIQVLATASGSWPTYDTHTGQWCVVINQPGAAIYSFDDDNIVGPINVTTTSIDQLYNSVLVEFPHVDLLDTTDSIYIEIEPSRRFNDELDRTMNMKFDIVNNPIHAQIIASRELKQNRVDKVIEFKTDFTMIGLQAGDVIDVTSIMYGFIFKKFRVISVEETDTDNGALLLSVIALEYDADVYSDAGLLREIRDKKTGITPQSNNATIQSNISTATGISVGAALGTPEGRAAITGAGLPVFETLSSGWSTAEATGVFGPGSAGNVANLEAILNPLVSSIKNIQFFIEGPSGIVNYTTGGVAKSITAGIPLRLDLATRMGSTGTWNTVASRYMEWSTYTTTLSFGYQPAGMSFRVRLYPSSTYDLNATPNLIEVTSVTPVFANAAGDAASITVALFLN